jgi:hypothetical protein
LLVRAACGSVSDSDFGGCGAFTGERAKTGGFVRLLKIFAYRPRDLARLVPIVRKFLAFRAPHDARIGLNHACVRGKCLAADQTGAKTGLKHAPEQIVEKRID